MDTTYFGRKFGIMVFRDYHNKKNIRFFEVDWETNELYRLGVRAIQEQWYIVDAIVCDWRRWVLDWFPQFPVQMCHVHQKRIIRRYITSKPKHESSIELKDITLMLWKLKKNTRMIWLDDWHRRYDEYLKERSENGKQFMHERIRKAYRSLSTNAKYLFTYQEYKGVPNTSNPLEAEFSHMKTHTRIHRWLARTEKVKLCFEFLSRTIK